MGAFCEKGERSVNDFSQYHAKVTNNRNVGPGLYVLTIEAVEIAGLVQPGQFIHMKLPRFESHLLRRPFSVYATTDDTIEILYQVVGSGTRHMSSLDHGDVVDIIGPIGRGWNPSDDIKRALLVGGGVGAAPLYLLAERLKKQGVDTTVVLGAQTVETLVCIDRYSELFDSEVRCATDDGSFGRAGFCTSLVEEALQEKDFDYLACCGPEPLMKIVASMVQDMNALHCEVSFERRMACGIGACLSCVVETVDGMKRACVDGPVFDARKVM